MKVKTVWFLTIIGIVALSIVVSSQPNNPYIYQVDWPRGTHVQGETLKFTAHIRNPMGMSYNGWLTLDITYPNGHVEHSGAGTFTIPPAGSQYQGYTTADIALTLNSHPPGTYKACINLNPWGGNGEGSICQDGAFTVSSGSNAPQFKVTAGSYSETANLDQAVNREFGYGYRVADWNDVLAHSGDIENWANNIGMNHGDYYFVTWNGQGFWNGGNRHYFITRFDHVVDSGYQVHDHIENNFITLGSWYGIQERILCISSTPTPACPVGTHPNPNGDGNCVSDVPVNPPQPTYCCPSDGYYCPAGSICNQPRSNTTIPFNQTILPKPVHANQNGWI